MSATYDLFGNGKTSVHASDSLYYQTKITLANALGGLVDADAPAWGNNRRPARVPHGGFVLLDDSNLDGIVQANELSGTPTSPRQPVRQRHRDAHGQPRRSECEDRADA